MNQNNLPLINAWIAALLGLGFLLAPDRIFGQPGPDGYAATELLSGFLGTAMLGLGLLLWVPGDVTATHLRKEMGIALLVGAMAAGLVVQVISTVPGILPVNGWLTVCLYALLGLANVYLISQKPKHLNRR